jgi:transposase
MAKPYSLDLRERVVAYVESGKTCKEASDRFDVSIASAVRWAARARSEGSPAAKPMGGRRRDALAGEREWLLAQVARQPDLTLHALLAQLERRGTKVCCDTLWRFLCREGLRFKKNRVRRGTEPA